MKNTTLMWIFGGIALAGAATAAGVYLARRGGVAAEGNASGGQPSGGAPAPKPAASPTNTLPPGSHYAAVDLLNAVAPIVTQYLPPNANPNARPEQLV